MSTTRNKPTLLPAVVVPNNDNLPAFLTAKPSPIDISRYGGASTYGCFVHPNARAFARIVQDTGAQSDEVVIVPPVGRKCRKLDELVFFLCDHFQHYPTYDGAGMITKVYPDWLSVPFAEQNDIRETVDTVILCVTDDALIPCRFSFRGTKVGIAKDAADALAKASDEKEWASDSAEHALTVQHIQHARMRYVTRATYQAATSKKTGRPYRAGAGLIEPSTPAQWKLLAEGFDSDEFRAEFDSCKQSFDDWKAAIEKQMTR